MKILVAGANGYIGTRLLLALACKDHYVYALVRSPNRLELTEKLQRSVTAIQGDLLDRQSLSGIPQDIDAAYYLVHSMGSEEDFARQDRLAAQNFINALQSTRCKQIIYLTGLANAPKLSKHLQSRLDVENILRSSPIPLTSLRAGIIIGSGSASFEIMRDLVEKLPIMVAPKWVSNRCQPIAVSDVIDYMTLALGDERCFGKTFDIGGEEQFTYKEMLLRLAKKRKLYRLIISVPVLTPKLSSYWLYFITATNYYLAKNLVESLVCDATCNEYAIRDIFPKKLLSYDEALERAFQKTQENAVLSSWKDSFSASQFPTEYLEFVQVPQHGCFRDRTVFPIHASPEKIFEKVIQMGGREGYYMDWAWRIRGLIDELVGGVGLRRGKTKRESPRVGDAIDFWRVLLIDRKHFRYLLFAEMKVPGEAWLEFKIEPKDEHYVLVQTAIFRPRGLLGRLYWYLLYPIHRIIFKGFGKKFIKKAEQEFPK